MSRLNLNSIMSWVDSYIIDYLRVNRNRGFLYLTFSISLLLLLFVSPIIVPYWLFFPTVYFLYIGSHKNIFIAWGFFFFSWYLLFTAGMFGFDGPIWIGGDLEVEKTSLVYEYVILKYLAPSSSQGLYNSIFGSLCIQTLMVFSFLSSKLGFVLYIPSLFKGLSILFKFLFGKGGNGSSA